MPAKCSEGKIYRSFWEAEHHIFPLNGFTGEVCGCGNPKCLAIGKHPRASNWQHTPLWDDEQLDNIEDAGWFDSGYGVLCKGLLVIDVDVRNGGESGYSALIEQFPEVAGAGLIVKSGRGDGGRHLYFRLDDAPAMVQQHPDFPGLDFKTSGYVVGPGSRHASGGVYTVALGCVDDIDEPPAALIDFLRKPDKHRAEYDGRVVDVSHADIADMLGHINPDCGYDQWIRIGMAVHDATGGTGFGVWNSWSAGGSKYDADAMESHWHSFGRSANPVTIGTLIHHAEEGGWVWPVTFGDDEPRDDDPPDVETTLADVAFDPARPPGMMGDVAAWIESQSRRPRAIAATGTAIWVASCLFAEYTDDIDEVNPNAICFVVAGSGTGKEAIQKAGARLVRAAGYAPAVHGTIKSEKEIVENLIRHQVAHYQIDEVGELLVKIRNAQLRGGAAHHEGTIGMLMSAYSKADNFLLIGGDRKEEAKAGLMKEAAALQKRIDENDRADFAAHRLASVKRMLESIDNGLERPYLTLIGYTVPQTFDKLMDFETATNGFMRRAIIFQEHDTAPLTKKNFRAPPMPEAMESLVRSIGTNGRADVMTGHRIELSPVRRVIPTSRDAQNILAEARDWFDSHAVAHKSRSGLEALFLGSYEQVSKISLLLGAWGGLREAEHVRWAFELVRRDVEAKALAVTANDRVKDSPKVALKARIIGVISGPEGESRGVIVNRCRKFKKADVERCIDEMEAAGEIVMDADMDTGGRPRKRYRAA